MKKIFLQLPAILFVGVMVFTSCKKPACEDCREKNKPPIAVAGTITLPADSVLLSGSTSHDPDGTIVSFLWSKISGPSSFTIVSPNAEQTWVKNLIPGTYVFELTVTDNDGLSSKAYVYVNAKPVNCDSNRPLVTAQLIPIGTYPDARENITIASAGSKILFAGGYRSNNSGGWQFYSRVDIFDVNTNTWASGELSQARHGMATAVLGNKIFFAGGVRDIGTMSSRVDIYDVTMNSWSTAELSLARTEITGAATGNKVLFAGGIIGLSQYSNTVDIFDTLTNTWSTNSLPGGEAVGATATVIDNNIYIAGNASDWWAWDFGKISSSINIYNVNTNAWSTSDLSIPRGYLAGIAIGNKNCWAGGVYSQPYNPFSTLVEIRDMDAGTSTFGCLFQPNAFFSAVLKNNRIIFFTSGVNVPDYWSMPPPVMQKFDIYDIDSNTWSIGVLPASIYGSSVISVNNTIYIAGGFVNGGLSKQVWKLEF